MRRFSYIFCFAFICLLSAATFVKAAQYKLHVLDVPQGRAYSAAYRINDQGIVAGVAAINYNARNDAGVYYWDATGVQYAGFALHNNNRVGLNDAGTIVGENFVSSNHTLTTLPKMLPTYGRNIFTDVNNAGIVVGESAYDMYGNSHAALWDNDGVHDLGTLSGDMSSKAWSINENGQVVGSSSGSITDPYSRTMGVIWDNGDKIETGILSGYTSSVAGGINNHGLVIGSCFNPDYYYTGAFEKAFTWQNGQLVDLLNRTDVSSSAADINDNRQIVGYTYSYYGPYSAFLWEDGSVTALEGLGGATLALGINNSGWIVGQALGSDTNWHAVVWEPVPEPSSLAALLSGIFVFGYAKRRKSGIRPG